MLPLLNQIRRAKAYKQGFTLVELLIIISIIGTLSSIAVVTHQRIVKKSHQNTLGLTLNSGARKIAISNIDGEEITSENCLKTAGLSPMGHFQMSCNQRSDGESIYDISAKPTKPIGVGGLLSFDANTGASCWKTCDANGSGDSATLSINHLSLDGKCRALKKKVTTYDCNCVTKPVETCNRTCRNEFYYCCPKHGGPCSSKCVRTKCTNSCRTTNKTTCDTCSNTEFIEST
ncbi:MAG: prepilin-type N-terminal cleavage/methylation domain-containing protein [Cyanobacteria bacterium K_DeepCast_35m_m2_155]|nr:prepilin-type N-terminal cleavage/methylation domain-containing protein [Cyanobacteria bacterium K_DeepCast_35m_m2_155]